MVCPRRKPRSLFALACKLGSSAAGGRARAGRRPHDPRPQGRLHAARVEETGLGAAVPNHPATGVAWLANRIAPHGESLLAGQVVLAGSFTRPVGGARGDSVHADYGPLGSVALRFG